MKKLIILLSLFFLSFLCFNAKTFAIADSTVYIAEPIYMPDTIDVANTLITLFKPDGSKIKEIYINGIMPRVSPDGRYFAYIEIKDEGKRRRWKAAIADSEGKKIRDLPFKGWGNFFPHGAWSPNGNKLAILLTSSISVILSPEEKNEEKIPIDARERIDVVVIDFDTGKMKPIHHTFSKYELESFTYTANWFPDNNRMLFAGGTNGTKIIHSGTGEYQLVSIDGLTAYLVDNGCNPPCARQQAILMVINESSLAALTG